MKVKFFIYPFLFIISTYLTGCGGIKFAQITPNLELPTAYKSRSIYESGVAAYEFNDLVGNILKIKKDNSQAPIRMGISRYDNSDTIIHIIGEAASLNYYHSFITKGGEVKGNYLGFAGGFTKDQMAEYTLFDMAYSSIPFSNASFNKILNDLKEWVRVHPKTDTTIKRIWIKTVVLSGGLYVAGSKINSNASGVLGSTVGVNGAVYNTNSQTIKNTIIGFEYFDIDELVGSLTNGTTAGVGDPRIITLLENQPNLVLKGSIKDGQ